jgi:hypothetical protein
VLQGLVSLFDKSTPSNAGWDTAHKKKIARLKQTLAKRAPRSHPVRQQAAQAQSKKRSFLDKLFGRNANAKPKRKTLFGF